MRHRYLAPSGRVNGLLGPDAAIIVYTDHNQLSTPQKASKKLTTSSYLSWAIPITS
jgi:hypothetical protein